MTNLRGEGRDGGDQYPPDPTHEDYERILTKYQAYGAHVKANTAVADILTLAGYIDNLEYYIATLEERLDCAEAA